MILGSASIFWHIIKNLSQLSEDTICQIHKITLKSSRIGSYYVRLPRVFMDENEFISAGRREYNIIPDAPWCLPQASCYYEPDTWEYCAVYTSIKSAVWDEPVCGHDESKWLPPFFYRLWYMFAEMPRWEEHLSIRDGCLDSCYVRTYPPFHCE